MEWTFPGTPLETDTKAVISRIAGQVRRRQISEALEHIAWLLSVWERANSHKGADTEEQEVNDEEVYVCRVCHTPASSPDCELSMQTRNLLPGDMSEKRVKFFD